MSTPPPSTVTDSSPLGSIAGGDGGLGGEAMRSRIAGRLFGQEAAPVKIGRFEVAEQIGTGGMGVVHRAYDPKLGRDVAVKVLHDDRVSPRERERMLREAQALAKLNHPNVVQVYEVGEHDDQLFIAMEYVAGRSAKQWQEGGKRPWREVLDVYLQAGEGLAAAHAAGIVHRDFKPANVLIGDDGRVRVADFGLARGSDGSSESVDGPGRSHASGSGGLGSDQLTKTGTVLGTPAYMAPEQLAGEPADERSDQFSFCVVLWETLVGTRPYSVNELRACRRREAIGSLSPKPAVPRRIVRAIARGLRIDPASRHERLAELLRELHHRRGNALRAVLFLAAAAVASTAVLSWWHSQEGVRERCRQLASRTDSDWSAERRREIQASLENAVPYGEDLWPLLESRISRRYSDWSDAFREICASGAPVDLPKLECLQHTSAQAKTATDLIDRVTRESASNLHAAVSELQSATTCLTTADVTAKPRPAGPVDLIESVGATRSELARAHIALSSHDIARARHHVEAAEAESKLLGYAPLIAEAGLIQARVLEAEGRFPQAGEAYERAAVDAQRSAHDDVLASAQIALGRLAARESEDPRESRLHLQFAEATLSRANLGHPRRREYQEAELELLREEGNLRAAESLARSLTALDNSMGGTDESRAWASRKLANLLADQGHEKAAALRYEELLSQRSSLLGTRHPEIASILFDLGLVETNPELALEHFLAAFSIASKAFTPTSPRVARYMTALAMGQATAGLVSEARATAQDAWVLQRNLPREHAERGSALALLVELDVAEGTDEALIRHLQTLVREWDHSAHRERFVEATNRLAWHLARLGRIEESRAQYLRLREFTAPGQRLRRFAELGLARMDLAEERYSLAIAAAEELRRESAESPGAFSAEYLSEIELTLGTALVRTDPNNTRGRALLRSAITRLEGRSDYAWAIHAARAELGEENRDEPNKPRQAKTE